MEIRPELTITEVFNEIPCGTAKLLAVEKVIFSTLQKWPKMASPKIAEIHPNLLQKMAQRRWSQQT